MELNHGESRYPDEIELMTHDNEKLKCRKVRAALRYHQPNPQKILNSMLIICFLHFIHFVLKYA